MDSDKLSKLRDDGPDPCLGLLYDKWARNHHSAESLYEIVPEPKAFVSPLVEIGVARNQTMKFENRIRGRQRYTDQAWFEYASSAQAWDELEAEQSRLEQELAETGEVELVSGRSYSFEFESYCVQGGAAHPKR